MHPKAMSKPRFAILSFLAFLQIGLACADRAVGDDELGDETGEQQNPFEPGMPYSDCVDGFECVSNWCLSPMDEPGFCTVACMDVDDCEGSPVGTAEPTCLPVGGDNACALDCGGGRTCPPGMRCEQVEAEGPRSICF
jgi:hypothetical protein